MVRRDRLSSESGIALLAVLLAMTLLTAIGVAISAVGIVELRSSINHRSATRALLLADAGATHAQALLRGPLAARTYSEVLLGDDGVGNTPDDGVYMGFGLPVTEQIPDTGVMLEDGRYFVTMVNDAADPSGSPYRDTNWRFVAVCQGTTLDGGEAEVRVLMAAPNYPAVATRGDLYLLGNAGVLGPCAGVHANQVLDVDGHPTVDGPVTASDTVLLNGTIYDGSGRAVDPDYQPPIDIPDYDPMEFCDDADYVLRDGLLITRGPPETSVSINGSNQLGWEWDASAGSYSLNAKDAVEGTVCAVGDIRVTGNLGAAGDPFDISLIATGSIQLSGTPVIEADHPDGILLLAGGDVQIGGNASGTTPHLRGTIYAGSQCRSNGNPIIDGHLLCYDGADPPGATNLTSENKINGNPTITYDCTGVRRLTMIAAWWETRAQ
jgi:hypothetical protein